MNLVDIHIHLDHPKFSNDLDAVIKNAEEAGVKAIIAQGVYHEVNLKVLDLAKKYRIVKAALGLYPTDAQNVRVDWGEDDGYERRKTEYDVDATLAFIEEHKKDIVAIGEVGIDFKETDDHKPQIENFKKVIALAKKIKKPLIIHSRKAEREVIELLEESGIRKELVVLHCFCGRKSLIKKAVNLGYYFSIPCAITRAQNFQILAEMVPITQLLTETDGPYLPPERDLDRSEPQHVQITINHIARIKGMDAQEVADNIFMNYQRLF